MPERIQRKRTKGWKMPQNTICVTRPTIFGNPFHASSFGRAWAVELHTRWLDGAPFSGLGEEALNHLAWFNGDWAIGRFAELRGVAWTEWWRVVGDLVVERLPGENLACWCPLDQPCHADVLLALANCEESCE